MVRGLDIGPAQPALKRAASSGIVFSQEQTKMVRLLSAMTPRARTAALAACGIGHPVGSYNYKLKR